MVFCLCSITNCYITINFYPKISKFWPKKWLTDTNICKLFSKMFTQHS